MNKTELYILKFGGTSVGSLNGINNIKKILLSNNNENYLDPNIKKIVIVSAASNSTNLLENLYYKILENNEIEFLNIFNQYTSHEKNLNKSLKFDHYKLDNYFLELKNTFKTYMNGEIDKYKLKDYVLSFGEVISLNRIYNILCIENSNDKIHKKIKKYYSWDLGFITDSNFGNARPLDTSFKLINESYNKILIDESPDIIITTGFIGKDIYNNITTIGRGGSDLSATLFAKALNPLFVQIWSDVQGVMTSDPRYIKNTKLVNYMTYNEALELSFFGAKILHSETIEPILEYNIPLYILNTFDLNSSGTIINNKQDFNKTESIVKGISFNNENSIIYIEPKNSFITNNFICNIFLILNSLNIKCSMISFSKTSLSICIKSELKTSKLLNRLSFNNSNKISCKDDIGVICVVGETLHETQGIASKIFSTVYECKSNIEMISQSVSQTNILFAIKQYNLINVVQKIHDNFV